MAIIEVKASGGWIQPFFSKQRYEKDLRKFKKGLGDYDPKKSIENGRKHLEKYGDTFDISLEQIFFLLPTLRRVHRKKSSQSLEDYEKWFETNSRMKRQNFILLSKNLSLDLTKTPLQNLQPTNRLEKLLGKLEKLTT